MVRPPFRYFGGKEGLAPWVVEQITAIPHDTYVEPFAGSAAVLMAKPRVKNEVLNDLDGDIALFFRVLRDQGEDLVDLLELTPYARAEFHHCQAQLERGALTDLERARAMFVVLNSGFAARLHRSGWSTSVRKGNNRARSTLGRIEHLPAIAERLMGVIIDNRPAEVVIPLYATESALVYCDPPYVHSTLGDRAGYRVTMSDDEHRALAEVLRSIPAAAVISGYHCDLYDDLFGDWHVVEVEVTSATAAGSSADTYDRTEVLWMNREPSSALKLFT